MTTLAWIIVLICVAITCYGCGFGNGTEKESKNPKCIQVGQSPYNPFTLHNTAPKQQIVDLENGHGVYQSDYNALQSENKELTAKIAELKAGYKESAEYNTRLWRDYKELEEENTKLKHESKADREYRSMAVASIQDKEKEVAKLKGELQKYDKYIPIYTRGGGNYAAGQEWLEQQKVNELITKAFYKLNPHLKPEPVIESATKCSPPIHVEPDTPDQSTRT